MTIAKTKLRLVEGERTRVCGIVFARDEEHEFRSVMAWKRRTHPQWSQHAVSYRVGDHP
jgi:hypothetical protein